MLFLNDTIVAPATAPGGALSLIRVSGDDALAVCDRVFRSVTGKMVSDRKGYTMLYGNIVYPDGRVLDDVVVSVFLAPNSYTGEDMVEISCHGSRYITAEAVNLLIAAGARAATAGEFTSRAFLAGKLDLSQAEAVADMISSHDRATHTLAATQMRGGYSRDLNALRDELLRLASLLELELDFSEEDVTFADRAELAALIEKISVRTEELISSFALGNAIKEGIAVAIVGSPNAGKSTLLNTLLNEDRVMVSDMAGTTRDAIEERVTLGNMEFRFIDTAGIRASGDSLERMGIERTFRAVDKARIILYLFDVGALTDSGAADENVPVATEDFSAEDVAVECAATKIISSISEINTTAEQELCIVINKCDPGCNRESHWGKFAEELEKHTGLRIIPISAKYGYNIGELTHYLTSLTDADPIYSGATIISNSRHYDALLKTRQSLARALAALSGSKSEHYLVESSANRSTDDSANRPKNSSENLPETISTVTSPSTDLIAQDIREALHWLGTITGEITTDEILGTIFSRFCIGK